MSEKARREMTLEEWVDRLPPNHKARNEHAQLEDELKKCEDDFEECAGVGMQLSIENAALTRELGDVKKKATDKICGQQLDLDALKRVVDACRGLQSILSLPWQEGHVTAEERAILTALEEYDALLTEAHDDQT